MGRAQAGASCRARPEESYGAQQHGERFIDKDEHDAHLWEAVREREVAAPGKKSRKPGEGHLQELSRQEGAGPSEELKAGQARGIKHIKWSTVLVEGACHKTNVFESL